MSQLGDRDLPDELREVGERLRAARPSFSASELDDLKVRTMARSSSEPRRARRASIGSRALTLVVAALLIGGTTGGAIAAGGAGGTSNAASAQYKLGNGCGHSDVHTKSGTPCPPH